jgi:hypothetical protein
MLMPKVTLVPHAGPSPHAPKVVGRGGGLSSAASGTG